MIEKLNPCADYNKLMEKTGRTWGWVLTSYMDAERGGRTGRERWDGWGRRITTDESRCQTETDSPLYMCKKSITIDRLAWCRKSVCIYYY